MGSLSSKEHRKQDAVLWGYSGLNRFGRATVSAAIPLKVRWVEEVKELVSDQNTVFTTTVTVTVDREIPLLSIMWEGNILDLPSPVAGIELYQVVFRNVVPNLKNRKTRYQVFLNRYSTTLPDVM